MRSRRGGYTVVETLIYLAVTGALFVGAAAMISGQQAKTEFNQAVREVETFILDIANDVTTGYYPSANVSCTATPGTPASITPGGSDELGARGDCLYLGRLFHVSPDHNEQKVDIYSIVGNRLHDPGERDVANLGEAMVQISDLLVESREFSEIISFKKLTFSNPSVSDTGAFGFVSSLASFDGDELQPGTISTHSLAVGNTTLDNNFSDIQSRFNQDSPSQARNQSPGVITLCVESNATDAHATIEIGSANSSSGVRTTIASGACS